MMFFFILMRTKDYFDFFFLENEVFTFHADCLLSRQFACNVKPYVCGKIRETANKFVFNRS